MINDTIKMKYIKYEIEHRKAGIKLYAVTPATK